VTPNWLYVGAASLTSLAAILFGGDWLGAGMLMLLLATPLDGPPSASRCCVWSRPSRLTGGATRFRRSPASPSSRLSYSLAQTQGWGSHALAAAILAFMLALHRERKGHEVEGRIWLARTEGKAWLLLPFALAGQWTAGLGALALYAAGSFFWTQHQVHGAPHPPPHD
jgi:hypothetical protein